MPGQYWDKSMSEKAPMQSTPFVSSTGETRNPIYEGQFEGETAEQAEARLHWAKVAMEMARNAALSAPSHGEQVRDGWKLVPVEPTREMISAASGAITTPDDLPPVGAGRWSMSDIAFRSRYRAALAAAPSAGSQGGDV